MSKKRIVRKFTPEEDDDLLALRFQYFSGELSDRLHDWQLEKLGRLIGRHRDSVKSRLAYLAKVVDA